MEPGQGTPPQDIPPIQSVVTDPIANLTLKLIGKGLSGFKIADPNEMRLGLSHISENHERPRA
jgi:hypothetical protein